MSGADTEENTLLRSHHHTSSGGSAGGSGGSSAAKNKNHTVQVSGLMEYFAAQSKNLGNLEEVCHKSSYAKKLAGTKTIFSDLTTQLEAEAKTLKKALDLDSFPHGQLSRDDSSHDVAAAAGGIETLEETTPKKANGASLGTPTASSGVSGAGLNSHCATLNTLGKTPGLTMTSMVDTVVTNTFGSPVDPSKLRRPALDVLLAIPSRSMATLCCVGPALLVESALEEPLDLAAVMTTLDDCVSAHKLVMELFLAHLNPAATNASSTGSAFLHTDPLIRDVLRECTDTMKGLAKFSILMQAAGRRRLALLEANKGFSHDVGPMVVPLKEALASEEANGDAADEIKPEEEEDSERKEDSGAAAKGQKDEKKAEPPATAEDKLASMDRTMHAQSCYQYSTRLVERAQGVSKLAMNFLLAVVNTTTTNSISIKTRTDAKGVAFQLLDVMAKQTLDLVTSTGASSSATTAGGGGSEGRAAAMAGAQQFCTSLPPLLFVLLSELALKCGDTTEAELLSVKLLCDVLSAMAVEDASSFKLLFSISKFCKPILEGILLCLVSVHPSVLGAGLSLIETIARTATAEAGQELGFVYCNCLLRLLDSENSSLDNKTTIVNHLIRVTIPDASNITSIDSLSGTAPPPVSLLLHLYWIYDLNPRLHHSNMVQMFVTSLARIVRTGADGLMESTVGTPTEPSLPASALNSLVTLMETVSNAVSERQQWLKRRQEATSSLTIAGDHQHVVDTDVVAVKKQRDTKLKHQRSVDIINTNPVKGTLKLFNVPDTFKTCLTKEEASDPEAYVKVQREIVDFLLYTPSLNPASMGEFLGDASNFCVSCCLLFMRSLPLVGKSITEALMAMLSAMQLPKEGQRIERVLEHFSSAFFELNRGLPEFPFLTGDATFLVVVATVMLNTDLHNPKISSKIDKNSFCGMTRGCNDGQNLPAGYAEGIFDSIRAQPLANVKGLGAAAVESATHVTSAKSSQGKMDMLFFSKGERKELMFGLERQRIVAETKELLVRKSKPCDDPLPSVEALARDFFLTVWPSLLAVFSVTMQQEHSALAAQLQCVKGLQCTLTAAAALNLPTEAEATMMTMLRIGEFKSIKNQCVKAVLAVAMSDPCKNLNQVSWHSVVGLVADIKRGRLDLGQEAEKVFLTLERMTNTGSNAAPVVDTLIRAAVDATCSCAAGDAAALSAHLFVLKRAVKMAYVSNSMPWERIVLMWKDNLNSKFVDLTQTHGDSSECLTLVLECLFQLISVGYVRCRTLQDLAGESGTSSIGNQEDDDATGAGGESGVMVSESTTGSVMEGESSNSHSDSSSQEVAEDEDEDENGERKEEDKRTPSARKKKSGAIAVPAPSKLFTVLTSIHQHGSTNNKIRLQLLQQMQQFVRTATQGGKISSTPHVSLRPPSTSGTAVLARVEVDHPLVVGAADMPLWKYVCQVLVLGLCDVKVETAPFAGVVAKSLTQFRFPVALGEGTEVGGEPQTPITPDTPRDPRQTTTAPGSENNSFTGAEDSDEEIEAKRGIDQYLVHVLFIGCFSRDVAVGQRCVSLLFRLAKHLATTGSGEGVSVEESLLQDQLRRTFAKTLLRCLVESLRVEQDVLRVKVIEALKALQKCVSAVPTLSRYFIEVLSEVVRGAAILPHLQRKQSTAGGADGSGATGAAAGGDTAPVGQNPHLSERGYQQSGLAMSFKILSFDRVPKLLKFGTPAAILTALSELLDILTNAFVPLLKSTDPLVTSTPETRILLQEKEDDAMFVLKECAVPLASFAGSSAVARSLGVRAFTRCMHAVFTDLAVAEAYQALGVVLDAVVVHPDLLAPYHKSTKGRIPTDGVFTGNNAGAGGGARFPDTGITFFIPPPPVARLEDSMSNSTRLASYRLGNPASLENSANPAPMNSEPNTAPMVGTSARAGGSAGVWIDEHSLAERLLTQGIVMTLLAQAPLHKLAAPLLTGDGRSNLGGPNSNKPRKNVTFSQELGGGAPTPSNHNAGRMEDINVLDVLLTIAHSSLVFEECLELQSSTAYATIRAKPGFASNALVLQRTLSCYLTLVSSALRLPHEKTSEGTPFARRISTKDESDGSSAKRVEMARRYESNSLMQHRFFSFSLDVFACYNSSPATSNVRQELQEVLSRWSLCLTANARSENKEEDSTGEEEKELWLVMSHPDIFRGFVDTLATTSASNQTTASGPKVVGAVQRYLAAYHERELHY